MTFVATQELEWYLFGTLYLLAAGYTMLHDEHVRVDIVYSSSRRAGRHGSTSCSSGSSSSPRCLLVIVTAWPFVGTRGRCGRARPTRAGSPARWALKSMIIVGFAPALLQGVSEAIKTFYWARGWETPATRPEEVH